MGNNGNGEEPKVRAVMQIGLLENGKVTVLAPMEDEDLCFMMLLGAMKVIAKHKPPETEPLVKVANVPIDLRVLKGHTKS